MLIEDRWLRIPKDEIFNQLRRLNLRTWYTKAIGERQYLFSNERYAYPYSLPPQIIDGLSNSLNMFDWQGWIKKFIDEPGYNDAITHRVVVSDIMGALFDVIGVHHLTPDENRGASNVYLDALDKNNQRIMDAKIEWTWEGRTEPGLPNPVRIGKPSNEIASLPIIPGMQINVWHPYGNGVNGIHANHPDELGPGGQKWNTVNAHSFLVVFRERAGGYSDPEPPPEPTANLSLSGNLAIKINWDWFMAQSVDSDGNVMIEIGITDDSRLE